MRLPPLSVRRPEGLLAAVPYLLGYHPVAAVAVLVLVGGEVVMVSCVNSRDPVDADDGGERPDGAEYLAKVAVRQRGETTILVAYCPPAEIADTARAIRDRFAAHGLPVALLLRVEGGRYRREVGGDWEPGEGTPFDPAVTAFAAAATAAGMVALPDRAAVRRRLSPVDGPGRAAVTHATAQELAAQAGRDPDRQVVAGLAAVAHVLRRWRAGRGLSDVDVARASVALRLRDVRDATWRRITPACADQRAHVELWSEVARRARADLVAAPALLAAFAAFLAGDGTFAGLACDTALACDPRYEAALLLDEVLRRGIPPAELRRLAAGGISGTEERPRR
ncbi:MAG: DUF4192 domain-containing protein [Mycobacteriales bacterium]